MKKHSAIILGLCTAAALAETGPSVTTEYELTQRINSTTCQLASRWSCEGTECPTCTIDKTGFRDVMRLNFPDEKITCFEGKVRVPDNIDINQDVIARFSTTRIGGIPGVAGGGTCTGGCAILDFVIAPVNEGTHLANYLWVPDPATIVKYYRSDLIPGGGPNAQGKVITAAVRGIRPLDLGLERRNQAGIRVCRDSRVFNASDTQTGTEGLDSMFIVWKTDPNPIESVPMQ